jgi:LPS sulfotransferase NodH
MKPKLSYTIWSTQRTGSTLLCKALESTGIAGKPNEWLNHAGDAGLVVQYGVGDPGALQGHLWEIGSTPNGVFGVKAGLYEPYFSEVLDTFRQFPGCPQVDSPRAEIWQHAFPNHRHIFMTRRNKVRLAVSWWKAIVTQEWHRKARDTPKSIDLEVEYHFDAIYQLFNECSMREAGTQEFFSEAGITPLTIFYEDFIHEYVKTVREVLDFLGLDSTGVKVCPPYYARLADEISEQWVQRFRNELQKDWQNKGW